MSNKSKVNWDKAYKSGKYIGDEPIKFTKDIVNLVQLHLPSKAYGFYPGCGNGRNYLPLLDAGLMLEGNDISSQAIQQLKKVRPSAKVEVGDFMKGSNKTYDYVVSIQLFQHGTFSEVKKFFDKTYQLINDNGLFFLRVNSVNTQIIEDYEVVENTPENGLTILYKTGQKPGQNIHFYSAKEIQKLTADRYKVILPLREEVIYRDNGTYWVQWETVLQKIK